MTRITLFTRPDCSLCRSALYVIERVRGQMPFELEVVDISAKGNERWCDEYKDHIPVVHVDGRELFRHRVDQRRLREAVERGQKAAREPDRGGRSSP